MDKIMSFEQILRKIVREENEVLLKSIKELLTEKTDSIFDSKPMVFDEACAYISYSSTHLYKLTSKNLIPHLKRGKKLYFLKSDLDTWLIENKVKTMDEIKEVVSSDLLKVMNVLRLE